MANNPPKDAAELVQRMKRAQEGDAKHPENSLPQDVRARLDAAIVALEAALARSQAGKAEAHEATASLREVSKSSRLVFTAVRLIVYAKYTDRSRTVEDYGYHPRTRHRGKSKDEPKDGKGGKPSKATDKPVEPTDPPGTTGKPEEPGKA